MAQTAPAPSQRHVEMIERMLAANARESLLDFVLLMNDGYEAAEHMQELCDALEAIERGDIDRLAISLPPRHGKSSTASEAFPAWFLGRNPRGKVIMASHTANLAYTLSRRARDKFANPKWPWRSQIVGRERAVALNPARRGMQTWETTQGGVVVAAGVGGSITGSGSDVLLIDDSVKGAVEVESPIYRDAQSEWFFGTASTRLEKGGRVVALGTRWMEDDLIGRILNSEDGARYKVINMPALYNTRLSYQMDLETGQMLERVPAEMDTPYEDLASLWPDRFPVDDLIRRRSMVGERNWSAQYQGSPQSASGSIWKDQDWNSYNRPSPDFNQLPAPIVRVEIEIDSAFTKEIYSDYSAIGVWGTDSFTGDGRKYLLGAWRGMVDFPELQNKVIDWHGRWANGPYAPVPHSAWLVPIRIEAKASGISLIQTLKGMGLPVLEWPGEFAEKDPTSGLPIIDPRQSKVSRAESAARVQKAHQAYLPNAEWPGCGDEEGWLKVWRDEHRRYPRGAHDDQCLIAGTMIATPVGNRPIEFMRAGDTVLVPGGVARVAGAGQTGVKPVVTRCGVTGTGSHPVFTIGAGFVPLDTIGMGVNTDSLSLRGMLAWAYRRQLSSRVSPTGSWGRESITSASQRLMLGGSAPRDFMWRSGRMLMDGRFLAATRFITETAIRSTTTLRTWSAYRSRSIAGSIRHMIPRSSAGILSAFVRSRQSGTRPMREENGTVETPLSHGIAASAMSGCASFARSRSWRIGRLDSVLPNARESFGRRLDAMTPFSRASFAGTTSPSWHQRTRPECPRRAAPHVEESSSPKHAVPVFNLTVEGAGCYYANGILVSNCDTTVMGCISLSQSIGGGLSGGIIVRGGKGWQR